MSEQGPGKLAFTRLLPSLRILKTPRTREKQRARAPDRERAPRRRASPPGQSGAREAGQRQTSPGGGQAWAGSPQRAPCGRQPALAWAGGSRGPRARVGLSRRSRQGPGRPAEGGGQAGGERAKSHPRGQARRCTLAQTHHCGGTNNLTRSARARIAPPRPIAAKCPLSLERRYAAASSARSLRRPTHSG